MTLEMVTGGHSLIALEEIVRRVNFTVSRDCCIVG